MKLPMIIMGFLCLAGLGGVAWFAYLGVNNAGAGAVLPAAFFGLVAFLCLIGIIVNAYGPGDEK